MVWPATWPTPVRCESAEQFRSRPAKTAPTRALISSDCDLITLTKNYERRTQLLLWVCAVPSRCRHRVRVCALAVCIIEGLTRRNASRQTLQWQWMNLRTKLSHTFSFCIVSCTALVVLLSSMVAKQPSCLRTFVVCSTLKCNTLFWTDPATRATPLR